MAGTVRSSSRTAGLAALITFITAATAVAQTPGIPAGRGTTVYLVVRTKSSVLEKRVTDTVAAGLAASDTTIDGFPTVKPVSPLFFEQFAELIGSPRAMEIVPADDTKDVSVRPLPSRDTPLHEIRLPSAKQTLTNLKVRYDRPAETGGEPIDEYAPKPPGEGPLTLIEPGRYAFRPDANRTPIEFTAVVDERDEQTRELVRGKELKGGWPDADKFYVVTLKNFRHRSGSRADHEDLLRAVARAQENEANPLTITRLGGDQVFLFADLTGEGVTPDEDFIKGNKLTLRAPGLPNRSPRRVWMLFPLTESEQEKALETYARFPTTELPDEIRKNAVPASEAFTFTPDSPAKWLELAPDANRPGSFSREITLDNVKGLVEKYPSIWRVTIWEFEKPGPGGRPIREVIQVKNKDRQDVSAVGSRILVWSAEPGQGGPK